MITQMKLLQLNMWGGRLEKPIVSLIKTVNPDILCLQEAIDLKAGNSAMFVATEEIQAVIGADHIFMSPVFTINYMNRKADFGNCIISKFPIKEAETIFTGRKYVADFDTLDQDANMRNLQHAVIELDGKSIHILNHHGHHLHQHKNGDAETMRQCGLIAKQIKKLTGANLILSGDFNLAPHSESLEQINKLLRNLAIEAKLKTTRTPLTHKNEVCDYIFVSEKIKVGSFKALPDIVSDHKALLIDFTV